MKNREIKFRFWNDGVMYDVFGLVFDGYGLRDVHVQFGGNRQFFYDIKSENYAPLMQYIGLQDKQGKDIYEGDILLVRFGKHRVEVRWNITGFGFFNLGTHQWQLLYVADLKQIEVIGNIYEHPHLLPDAAS